MAIIYMIVAGGVLGSLVTFILRTDGHRALLQWNMAAGVIGAFVGGLLLAPLLGAGRLVGENYNIAALLAAALGAVIVILPLNLLRRKILS